MNIFDILLAQKVGGGGEGGDNIFTVIVAQTQYGYTCDTPYADILEAINKKKMVLFVEYTSIGGEPTGRIFFLANVQATGTQNWLTMYSIDASTVYSTGNVSAANLIIITLRSDGTMFPATISLL